MAINICDELSKTLKDLFKGLHVDIHRCVDKTHVYIGMDVEIENYNFELRKGRNDTIKFVIDKIIEKKESLPLVKNEEKRIRLILKKLVKKHLKLKEENEGLKRYYDFYMLKKGVKKE